MTIVDELERFKRVKLFRVRDHNSHHNRLRLSENISNDLINKEIEQINQFRSNQEQYLLFLENKMTNILRIECNKYNYHHDMIDLCDEHYNIYLREKIRITK